VGGKHEHFGGRKHFEQLTGGFEAIQLGHGDVHQDHVRPKFFGQRDRFPAILGFADNLKVVFEIEHFPKSLTHDGVVFGEQNSDFFHIGMTFALFGFHGTVL
jgi:hypothetical protein